MHTYIEFKKARAIARKIINKKKRENFFNYCSTINRFTNIKYMYGTRCTFKKFFLKIQEYQSIGINSN